MKINFIALACLAILSSNAFGIIVHFGSFGKNKQHIEVSKKDVFEQPGQDDYQITRLFDNQQDILVDNQLIAVFLDGDANDSVFFANIDGEGRVVSDFKIISKGFFRNRLELANRQWDL